MPATESFSLLLETKQILSNNTQPKLGAIQLKPVIGTTYVYSRSYTDIPFGIAHG